jgi:hypothetical protein
VTVAPERLDQDLRELLLVVDDEDRLRPDRDRASAVSGSSVPAGRGTTGSVIANVVPFPGSLTTVMAPPCSSMMPRQSESPNPVP